MEKKLRRNHRTLGFELARMSDPLKPDQQLSVLHTSKSPISGLQLAPAHLLFDVSPSELAFEAQMRLMTAIEDLRFLGLDDDALQAAFAKAMETAG